MNEHSELSDHNWWNMNAKFRTRLTKRTKLQKGQLAQGGSYYFTRKPAGLKLLNSGKAITPTRPVQEKAKANAERAARLKRVKTG